MTTETATFLLRFLQRSGGPHRLHLPAQAHASRVRDARRIFSTPPGRS